MTTKNTKMVKIFCALLKAAMAEGWTRTDVVRDLGPDADLHMADYQVSDLAFTVEGCYGNTLNLHGSIAYVRYENGDETVHWCIDSDGQNFYYSFRKTDVTEYQHAINAAAAKLTKAAARGAKERISDFHPFTSNDADRIGIATDKDGQLMWYVSLDLLVSDRAQKAQVV